MFKFDMCLYVRFDILCGRVQRTGPTSPAPLPRAAGLTDIHERDSPVQCPLYLSLRMERPAAAQLTPNGSDTAQLETLAATCVQ